MLSVKCECRHMCMVVVWWAMCMWPFCVCVCGHSIAASCLQSSRESAAAGRALPGMWSSLMRPKAYFFLHCFVEMSSRTCCPFSLLRKGFREAHPGFLCTGAIVQTKGQLYKAWCFVFHSKCQIDLFCLGFRIFSKFI